MPTALVIRSSDKVLGMFGEGDRRDCAIGSLLEDESREKETIQEEVDAEGVEDSGALLSESHMVNRLRGHQRTV